LSLPPCDVAPMTRQTPPSSVSAWLVPAAAPRPAHPVPISTAGEIANRSLLVQAKELLATCW
jgi:hypothetical protein